MDIRNFDRIRVGSGDTSFLDISNVNGHEYYGIMAVAYQSKSSKEYFNHIIEVRQKEGQIALFTLEHDGVKVPEYWEDAEILFRWSEKGI